MPEPPRPATWDPDLTRRVMARRSRANPATRKICGEIMDAELNPKELLERIVQLKEHL